MPLKFTRQIFEKKNIQISNFINICSVGDELLHADGGTDITKLIIPFCSFVKAPNKRRGKHY